jgi:hypothetical protein
MPAESVLARAVITRPAPRPATAGLAPLAGHVLFRPGQAARSHSDGGTTIAHHRARQRMQARPNGRRARGPWACAPPRPHQPCQPRAVSAGCSRCSEACVMACRGGRQYDLQRGGDRGTERPGHRGRERVADLAVGGGFAPAEFPGVRKPCSRATIRTVSLGGWPSGWPGPGAWSAMPRPSTPRSFQAWRARVGPRSGPPYLVLPPTIVGAIRRARAPARRPRRRSPPRSAGPRHPALVPMSAGALGQPRAGRCLAGPVRCRCSGSCRPRGSGAAARSRPGGGFAR